MVCPQIQPGTRSDLEKPYRQIGSAIDAQQPADQRGRSAHLIGLRWLIQSRTQRVGMVGRGQDDLGPGGSGVPGTAGAGIPAAQLGCPAVEHQPVQATEQSKRQRVARRIIFVTGQNRCEDAAGFDVLGHELIQLVVHQGAGGAAEPPLRPQGVQQVFSCGLGIHGSSPFSPAPTTSNAFPSASGNVTDSSLNQVS